jgi:hypothetical protein
VCGRKEIKKHYWDCEDKEMFLLSKIIVLIKLHGFKKGTSTLLVSLVAGTNDFILKLTEISFKYATG